MHWFNQNRLHSSIGYLTPLEKENTYYRENNPQSHPALGEPALHQTRGGSYFAAREWMYESRVLWVMPAVAAVFVPLGMAMIVRYVMLGTRAVEAHACVCRFCGAPGVAAG